MADGYAAGLGQFRKRHLAGLAQFADLGPEGGKPLVLRHTCVLALAGHVRESPTRRVVWERLQRFFFMRRKNTKNSHIRRRQDAVRRDQMQSSIPQRLADRGVDIARRHGVADTNWVARRAIRDLRGPVL